MAFGGRTETDIICDIRSMGDVEDTALKKTAYDGMHFIWYIPVYA